ncbi:ATP-binding cassette domain-containing protein [Staphylococcus schleiferi subsp. coagulans]|uniref:ATP-binding cassette domain-containing protein n=1 Tax=Staphylococcus coagulans TaxID=74706 RepID=UPI0015FCAF5C|nr:ATP-binding cassette domain-containing protein [Staphylococcus coagulans]MBA8760081.1 ATP-binding cassette domain-containing protein [Staphylococcus coagulans]MBA8768812.1 ATP-binding cassette domain-containing protein [Staphylococcus coagulans]
MIKLEHINVKYQTQQALKDVTLKIEAHEKVGILGGSGSGKSTLASVMLGEVVPQSGQVVSTFQYILPIYQHAVHAFNPKLSIEASMNEAFHYNQKKPEFYCHYRDELMHQMQLSETLLKRYPSALSGGQLQRFNVIRTLMLQPDLLICDEVTAHLDVIAEDKMAQQLNEHAKRTQKAMVIISHDIAFLQKIVSRIIVLKAGEIVDAFPIENLFHEERAPYTKSLLSLYQ